MKGTAPELDSQLWAAACLAAWAASSSRARLGSCSCSCPEEVRGTCSCSADGPAGHQHGEVTVGPVPEATAAAAA